MDFRIKNSRKAHKIRKIITNNIASNKREYIIITVLFLIGLLAGVLFVNNIKEDQFSNISQYINNFVESYKNVENIDTLNVLKESISNNIGAALIICFFGTTVIGLPVVFGAIIYRGFCLGYTISSCISVLGIGRGLAFILSDLLLQNLIFIPAIIAIAVSGFKLYKSIIKDKRRENIKLEIMRHLVFSLVMAIVIVIASLVEIFISNNILKLVVKYF